MKNRRFINRFISWIMTLVMIAGEMQLPQLSLTAAAYGIEQTGSCGVSATYSVSGSTLIISGNGAIEDYAFEDKDLSGITSLFIGKDITAIGVYAFYECTGITELTFEEGSNLIDIQAFAFSECTGIKNIVFPEKLSTIGERAFADCNLNEITLHKGLTEIGDYAFYDSNLSHIHFMGSGKEWNAIVKGDYAYAGIVDFSEGINYAVIFKVKNGSWNNGYVDDVIIYKSGDEGDTIKLDETDIPAVGLSPFENYAEGSWDTVPEADTIINSNRTYTYSYEPCDHSVNVTFKVKNGSWDDGTKEDKSFTLNGKWNNIFLTADQLPAVGSKPDEHYVTGSWDKDTGADNTINSDCIYTYSYEPDNFSANVTFRVKNGSWDDGTKEDKSVTLNGKWFNTFLTADQLPAVGSRPDEDCHSGRWDNSVLPTISPEGDVILTYSYEKNSGLGSDAILNPATPGSFSATNTWTGSYVYFGNYKAENQTDAAPVKYRVLDNHADKFGKPSMLLDCDTVLFKSAFNPKNDTKWEGSIAYKALNTNDDSFLNTAFSAIEQEAIANSTINSHPYTSDPTQTGVVVVDPLTVQKYQNYTALSGEKIFLLDIEDASNTAYGYSISYYYADTHRLKNTLTTEAAWRLRSKYITNPKYICLVNASGKFYNQDTVNIRGMSPALNIDLSSVIKTSPVSSEPGAFKLMITDKGLNIALTEGSSVTSRGNTFTVPFTITDSSAAADPGRVSVIITNGSWGEDGWSEGAELLQYTELDIDSFALTGEGEFTLDPGISGKWGEDYHVYLIAEDINGKKETDYASVPVELPIPHTKNAISVNVTFKVVNGSWDDDSKEDKTVTLNGYEGDELKLSANDIPAVGNKPDVSYTMGAWDVTPSVNTVITADTVYTYSYAKKTSATVTAAPVAKTLSYNGADQELVSAGTAEGGSIAYSLSENGAYSENIPTAVNVGTYKVYYKAVGDENHLDSVVSYVEAAIMPKAVNITEVSLSQNSFSYTGSGISPEVIFVKAGSDELAENDFSVSYSDNINAGTAHVTVSAVAGGNYSFDDKTVDFTIDKAAISPVVAMADFAQGSEASTPVVTGNPGNGAVTFLYKLKGASDSTYLVDVPSEEGSYTVSANIAETDNYLGGYATGDFNILKAAAAVTTIPAANSLTYNGSAQALVSAGAATGGTIKYAKGSSEAPAESFSESIPTEINAGTYYVWYKAFGDADHTDSAMGSVMVVISKVSQAAPSAPTKQSSTTSSITLTAYNGYEYCLSGHSWQSSNTFSGLNADTEYTFFQRISGDANHEASPASAAATFRTDALPTEDKPTPTDKVSPTPSENVTPTPSENATPTPTGEADPTPTGEDTPTPTVTVTPTPTAGPVPTYAPTPTPTPVIEEAAEMKFVFEDDTDTFSTEYTGSEITPVIKGYCGSRPLSEGVDYSVRYGKNINAGKVEVTVKGKNGYSGTYKLSFTIEPKQIADESGLPAEGIVVSGLTVQGDKAVKPVIIYNGTEIKKGIKAKISKAADDTETVSFTADGGNFAGEIKDMPVNRIKDKEEFAKAAIRAEFGKVSRVYDGTPQLLGADDLKVTDQAGNKLTEGTDYAVSYSADVINAGTVNVQVTGIGSYTGSTAFSYKIAPAADAAISVQLIPEEGMQEGSYSYSKNKVTPAVFVTASQSGITRVLSEGIDYTLRYSNNAKADETGKIKFSFIGNYKGAATPEVSFTIVKASLGTAEIFVGDMLYKKAGKYRAKPVVTVNGEVVASSEYSIKYSVSGQDMPKTLKLDEGENEKTVTVTVTSKNKGFADGTEELSATYRVYRDSKTDISKAKVSLVVKDGSKALKNAGYTGNPITFDPSNEYRQGDIKVKIGKTVLTGAEVFKYFDVSYADNVKKGNKAAIIITAKEDSPYSGMASGKFKIVARKVK